MRHIPPLLLVVLAGCGRWSHPALPAPVSATPPAVSAAPDSVRAAPTIGFPPLAPLAAALQRPMVRPTGHLRAVVFPIALGLVPPIWSDTAIAALGIGREDSASAHGAAALLQMASGGRVHFTATVMPTLVAPDEPDSLGRLTAMTSQRALRLYRGVAAEWATRINLGSFDNDGPDGQPLSGDDDGAIDLPIFVVETDGQPAVARVHLNLTVRVGKDGRLTRRLRDGYVVSLPKSRVSHDLATGFTTAVLRAMGVPGEEVFADLGLGVVSPMAKLRLGWIASRGIVRSGVYDLPQGVAVAIPTVEGEREGFVVMERTDSLVAAVRVLKDRFGGVVQRRIDTFRRGEASRREALGARFGGAGEYRLAWYTDREGRSQVQATVALSAAGARRLAKPEQP